MEEKEDKKQIKMSLGTFSLLIVSLLILSVAIAFGIREIGERVNTPQVVEQNLQQQKI